MKKTLIFGSNSPSKTELSVSPNFEINGFSSSKKVLMCSSLMGTSLLS
jgi:hypothetical protein